MAERLVFVSHKHKDSLIATKLGDFLRVRSAGNVDVYVSSDPRFKGPRLGNNLDAELRAALARAGVTILIYSGTAPGWDWSYCMYECGFATKSGARLLVLQCGVEAPQPFQDRVRIKAVSEDEIYRFVQSYMTDVKFFEDQQGPVTAFNPQGPEVKAAAKELFMNLDKAITQTEREPQEWSPWPFIRLRLSGSDIETISKAPLVERVQIVKKAILASAEVVDSKAADRIFGVGVDDGQLFEPVFKEWQQSTTNPNDDWLDSLGGQIASSIKKHFPTLRDFRIKMSMGDVEVIPVVTRTFKYPADEAMEFNIHFYDIRRKSPSVEESMIPRDRMKHRVVKSRSPDIGLKELHQELTTASVSRLPVLDEAGRVVYMVHKSMIDQFITQSALNGENVNALRLKDVLADAEMRKMFEKTFVCVPSNATIEEAREAMSEVESCRDVFVTSDGEANEPVLGWLTSKRLLQLE